MSQHPDPNPCDLGTLLESGRYKSVILDSIADGVFAVDAEWRICSFNRAAEEITGIARAEAMGRQCSEVFRASICESACALRETMRTGRAHHQPLDLHRPVRWSAHSSHYLHGPPQGRQR